MIKIKDAAKCSGCMACVLVCSQGAIASDASRGFLLPRVDVKKCVDCGRCEQVCPRLSPPVSTRVQDAYIAYTTDGVVREHSTAGGVFVALALRTLSRGGAVFGAAYTPDGGCAQVCVQTPEELERLIGRKYVYSDPGGSYAAAKELLLAGREVLYAGTPCQIAGLTAYLGAPYRRLIRVEVGCGGVATLPVWRAFLSEYGENCHVSLTNRIGEENRAAICLECPDGTSTVLARAESEIHRAISLGLGICPACENCAYDAKRSCADLSLRRYNPAFDDESLDARRQPMTLVLVRTAAGAQAFSELSDVLESSQIPREKAYRHIEKSKREKKYAFRSRAFSANLERYGFGRALKRYSGRAFLHPIGQAMKKIFLKV